MHLHSNFSDGENSIEQMTQTAINLGLEKITFTDHVRKSTKWIDKYIKEIKNIQKKYPKIKIYSGIEAKVIDLKGNIDAKNLFFKKIDLVLAAFHRIPKGNETYLSSEDVLKNKQQALKLWYKAMMELLENKNVDIIAHPTSILKRYKIKLPSRMKEKIAKRTKKEKKIFEISGKHQVPNKKFIEILKKNKVKLMYGSDSHSIEELKKYTNGHKSLERKNPPMTSLIIPCRNEEKFIAECLDSVIEQDYPKEKMEVLVIDGASEDKTKDIIKGYSKKYPFIKLLDNPQKITPCAFNIGIKKSKGDFIFIMGSHAKYQNNYISKCIETALKYNADNVGGIHKIFPNKKNIIPWSISLCLSSTFGVGNSYYKTGYSKKIKEVDTVFGGCYKKEVFKKIGLFNEKLVRSQDMELNIRLKKAGGKILLNPEIISYYYPKSTLREFFKHNVLDGIWTIYPTKIANIPLKLRHYIPLLFVLSLLFTLLLSIFFSLFIYLFIFILGIYLIISLYFSAKIALKEKNIRYLFLMPIVFACRHFGYGLGSLWGILSCWRIKK